MLLKPQEEKRAVPNNGIRASGACVVAANATANKSSKMFYKVEWWMSY